MSTIVPIPLLMPDWPAPSNVRACVTTRRGGVSSPPWESFNLALHVGDDPIAVAENRRCLANTLGLSDASFGWLQQVHGTRVLNLPVDPQDNQADASFTDQPGQVCVVMTADCLPVLFCDRSGTRVAAAHAGWRGLAGGVLEATLAHFPDPAEVMVWLGPAIGPQAFEVGQEVRDSFLVADADAATCFLPSVVRTGYYFCDLYGLARRRLALAGVIQVFGGGFCTFSDPDRFYSFRRAAITGRMAALIWRV